MSLFKDEDRTAIIKRLLILFAIIILIFAIINATWYFGYRQRYSIIAKNLEATYLFGENDDDMTFRRYSAIRPVTATVASSFAIRLRFMSFFMIYSLCITL